MKLSTHDEIVLKTVHPKLAELVRKTAAIGVTPFSVIQGGRSVEQQKKNIAKGVSWTMNSRHIASPDGKARAVDIAPFVNGIVSWTWEKPGANNDFFELMLDVKKAAKAIGLEVEWGGVWDRRLSQLSNDLKTEVQNYAKRQKAKGKTAHPDGPHIQLLRSEYP